MTTPYVEEHDVTSGTHLQYSVAVGFLELKKKSISTYISLKRPIISIGSPQKKIYIYVQSTI